MRPRDTAFEALAELHGGYQSLTSSCRGRINKALKEIREVSPDVDREQIVERVHNLRTHFPKITLTATAMAMHWAMAKNPSDRQFQAAPRSRFSNFSVFSEQLLSSVGA